MKRIQRQVFLEERTCLEKKFVVFVQRIMEIHPGIIALIKFLKHPSIQDPHQNFE
jgi:hypothetical protein